MTSLKPSLQPSSLSSAMSQSTSSFLDDTNNIIYVAVGGAMFFLFLFALYCYCFNTLCFKSRQPSQPPKPKKLENLSWAKDDLPSQKSNQHLLPETAQQSNSSQNNSRSSAIKNAAVKDEFSSFNYTSAGRIPEPASTAVTISNSTSGPSTSLFSGVSVPTTNFSATASSARKNSINSIQKMTNLVKGAVSKSLFEESTLDDGEQEERTVRSSSISLSTPQNYSAQDFGKHENFFKISKEIAPPVTTTYDASKIARIVDGNQDTASKNKEFFKKLKEAEDEQKRVAESMMDPFARQEMESKKLEDENHGKAKTHHFSKLGQATVNTETLKRMSSKKGIRVLSSSTNSNRVGSARGSNNASVSLSPSPKSLGAESSISAV